MERIAKITTDFLSFLSLLSWLHRFLLGIAGRKLLKNLFMIPSFSMAHVFSNGTRRNFNVRGMSKD